MKFIDTAKILLKAGDGGAGHISFHREKFVPKGGPDGGNGGDGGNVVFQADSHLNTLLDFRYKRHYKATDGNPGGKNNRSGRGGDDLVINVPCGTIIKNSLDGETIVDLTGHGDSYIVAMGGKGGRGNAEFTTPTNQAPRTADPGIPGEELEVELELKLIADVGIVGFPNAGKSTLISVISAAKPKIADYPFTTLTPNLGMVYVGENMSFTVADMPGLIEGASEGKGLGHQFLRHIERTRLLVILIDAASADHPAEYDLLMEELGNYNISLLTKDRILCISKIDIAFGEMRDNLLKLKFKNEKEPALLISSVTGDSIEKLKMEIWKKLNKD